MQKNNARMVAAKALIRQEANGYANLVWNAALQQNPLPAREAAFAAAVFYGTTERLLTLDFILQQFIKKPLSALDKEVRAILRSGLYQAKYMDAVPVRAAVAEAVELTRAFRKASACGMVNAVLRKAADFSEQSACFATPVQRLSVLYSVSPSIAAYVASQYPQQAEEILQALFQKPATAVRVNTLRTTAQQLAQRLQKNGVQAQAGALPHSLRLVCDGSPAALPEFAEGLFQVQSEPSQTAAGALCAGKGQKILDLCAAPGGKSAVLAQDMENEGTLICCDAAQNRLSLIQSNLQRMGITCAKIMQWNAAEYNPDFADADAVLCDVPCSGLGTIAKKPDIRYKDLQQVSSLPALQYQILSTAARYVKAGGKIVYSTCTFYEPENGAVVRRFLAENPNFKLKPISCNLPNAQMDEQMVTFLPNNQSADGFFVALLERVC